ncbi:lens fiber major intrinsic protein-like protein [Lates japonicus]|uniref:Lens fiber major intrinsic protein-like protein n=1 Tax=Lates japonicus TaxID=270547 RepID=A0AAD3M2H0_LATJO|nr:lens fiber major intrinsic protein-like protein [Lates japonicus]
MWEFRVHVLLAMCFLPKFYGTMFFVFLGWGSLRWTTGPIMSSMLLFCFGLAVANSIQSIGHISGGHINLQRRYLCLPDRVPRCPLFRLSTS